MVEQIKKSYNPFKMWGSWAGVVIFFILSVSFNPGGQSLINRIVNRLTGYWISTNNFILSELILSWTILLTGFLIGWGIHSLIRRFKK